MLRTFLLFLLLAVGLNATQAQDYAADIALITGKDNKPAHTKYKPKFVHFTPPYWIYKFSEKKIKPQVGISERYEVKLRQFAKYSFKEFGFIKGYFMSIDRINRTGRLGYIDFPSVRLNKNGSIIDLPKYYRLK
jgi:hypothetical protein